MIHAIILARKGSKQIKNKNLIKIRNKPLIYWSIKKSLISKKIYKTWVSSDCKKILNYSLSQGANIINRPSKFAKNTSSSEEAWKHAIEYIKQKNFKITECVGIQPTSPIRNNYDFDNAIRLFKKSKFDSLFSSIKIYDFNTWKISKKKLIPNYDYLKRSRRQDIKNNIIENGSFYIFNINKFLKYNNRLFGNIGTFIQEKKCGYQIDDQIDLKIIKSLF